MTIVNIVKLGPNIKVTGKLNVKPHIHKNRIIAKKTSNRIRKNT